MQVIRQKEKPPSTVRPYRDKAADINPNQQA
jgi:hypothetical protein